MASPIAPDLRGPGWGHLRPGRQGGHAHILNGAQIAARMRGYPMTPVPPVAAITCPWMNSASGPS
ncbi:MAG TPA: hypothetical protein PKX06_12360, partial [Phenylobacterium sp.]|nr:hypothetical protein [Phenylobacterium sp.]